MPLPPRERDMVREIQKRWPSGGYGYAHTTRFLRPHELRRCPAPSCLENIAFRDECRTCLTPTIPLW